MRAPFFSGSLLALSFVGRYEESSVLRLRWGSINVQAGRALPKEANVLATVEASCKLPIPWSDIPYSNSIICLKDT